CPINKHGREVDHSSWGKGIRSSRSRDFARMENRWSCPANESGAWGRCRLGRGSHFSEGGSLENRRRYSRSVSGRTATGAGKGRGKRQSGSERVASGSLWQHRGRHGRHYNVKTAKSKHF